MAESPEFFGPSGTPQMRSLLTEVNQCYSIELDSRPNFLSARQHLNGPATAPTSRVGREIVGRRKAAKMLIAVVLLFFVCYLPTHIWNIG